MPKRIYHIKTPYDADILFDLVSDIESYPEFLPWVVAARIIEQEQNIIIAELIIKYKIFKASYTSKVTLFPKRKIIVDLIEGPFKHLSNQWIFNDGEVQFMLDFELKSKLLEGIISDEFELYAEKMMAAFNQRAIERSQ